MSWNITGIGTKAALHKQNKNYFDQLIQSSLGTPNEIEYRSAQSALYNIIESAPDGHLLDMTAYGSASYENYSSFQFKVDVKLVVLTFME